VGLTLALTDVTLTSTFGSSASFSSSTALARRKKVKKTKEAMMTTLQKNNLSRFI
jgi:hypothetical protein